MFSRTLKTSFLDNQQHDGEVIIPSEGGMVYPQSHESMPKETDPLSNLSDVYVNDVNHMDVPSKNTSLTEGDQDEEEILESESTVNYL